MSWACLSVQTGRARLCGMNCGVGARLAEGELGAIDVRVDEAERERPRFRRPDNHRPKPLGLTESPEPPHAPIVLQPGIGNCGPRASASA